MNNNNGTHDGAHRDRTPALELPADVLPPSDEPSGTDAPELVEAFIDVLRAYPEVWLPALDDEEAWVRFAEEAQKEAQVLGVDLAAITYAANEQALADLHATSSPKANRVTLASYLKERREASQLTVESVAAYSPGLTTHELRRFEDGRSPIFGILEKKEEAFSAWVRRIGGDMRRILRLLQNCPYPSEWQNTGDMRAPTYRPAGSHAEVNTEYILPRRAQAIIDRLYALASRKDDQV